MKREGSSVPCTGPACKRSRLHVSTVGSLGNHPHLVLHFRGNSQTQVPGNHVKNGLENVQEYCSDKKWDSRVWKTQRVEEKEEETSYAKAPPTQRKYVQKEERNYEICIESFRGKLSPSEGNTAFKLGKDCCCTGKHETRKKTCRETTPRWQLGNGNISRKNKLKFNRQTPGYTTPLLKTTPKAVKKSGSKTSAKPKPCHRLVYLYHSFGYPCRHVKENGRHLLKREQKQLLQKDCFQAETSVEDSRQSKWYVSPVSRTRKEARQPESLEEKSCNRGAKDAKPKTIARQQQPMSTGYYSPIEQKVSQEDEKGTPQHKTRCVHLRNQPTIVETVGPDFEYSGTSLQGMMCRNELHSSKDCNCERKEPNLSSNCEQAKSPGEKSELFHTMDVTTVSNSQSCSPRQGGEAKSPPMEDKIGGSLFQMHPWENDPEVELLTKKLVEKACRDPGKVERENKLMEVWSRQQTVAGDQQLSNVHVSVEETRSSVRDGANEAEIKCRHTLRTKVAGMHFSTSLGSSLSGVDKTCCKEKVGATEQGYTEETGTTKRELFAQKGQKKGTSLQRVIMNGGSLHSEEKVQNNCYNGQDFTALLQTRLVIEKHYDDVKDLNGPMKSADPSVVIDDITRHGEPMGEDVGNRSGGSDMNGPIRDKPDSSVSNSQPITEGIDSGTQDAVGQQTDDQQLSCSGRMSQATTPVTTPKKLDLEVADLVTLAPGRWLNDNVINAYLELLAEVRPDDVYCFNTFFYSQLSRKGYQGVKRWTKKVQIFQKTLLLLPLHLGNHWCLAEVVVQDKLLWLYDSQGGCNLTCIQRLISYLCCEAEERGKAEFTAGWDGGYREDIPTQETNSDCGVYVCQYARCRVEERPLDFTQDDIPKFRGQMMEELLQQKLL